MVQNKNEEVASVKTKKQFPCRMADVIFRVHSYRAGQIDGWLSHPRLSQPVKISSIPQLLLTIDGLLEEASQIAACSDNRTAAPTEASVATLRLQILFREHYTWQGLVVWEEQEIQATFLSVLELVKLLDEMLSD